LRLGIHLDVVGYNTASNKRRGEKEEIFDVKVPRGGGGASLGTGEKREEKRGDPLLLFCDVTSRLSSLCAVRRSHGRRSWCVITAAEVMERGKGGKKKKKGLSSSRKGGEGGKEGR